MRVLTLLSCLALLTACTGNVKRVPVPATLIEVPVPVYVPIDKALTKPCTWVRQGKPSQVFEVAEGRKRCLDLYEINLRAIDKVQGLPVPANGATK